MWAEFSEFMWAEFSEFLGAEISQFLEAEISEFLWAKVGNITSLSNVAIFALANALLLKSYENLFLTVIYIFCRQKWAASLPCQTSPCHGKPPDALLWSREARAPDAQRVTNYSRPRPRARHSGGSGHAHPRPHS
eukprot:Tamp_27869.p1 GENE.Tamp_27869~~Tamp_27869.p1  ORF type:complete len:135 (-),score=9.52 Tamp_27869:105-509(-)